MRISINKIDFDITPIAPGLRTAILGDPLIAQGVWRDVWAWDQPTQTGKPLVGLTPNKGLPLPNGLSFFMPRVTDDGGTMNNPGPSKRMGARVMEAVGAKTATDILRALNSTLNLPQKVLPLEAFAPINALASYTIKAHVDFAVVQMRNAGRNLTAYLLVPGQVAFHHEVTAVPDAAAYDAALAENPKLGAIQPAFIVPARTRANLQIRQLALQHRIDALRPAIEAIAAAAKGDGPRPDEATTREVAKVLTEWRALAQASEQAARTAPAATGAAAGPQA